MKTKKNISTSELELKTERKRRNIGEIIDSASLSSITKLMKHNKHDIKIRNDEKDKNVDKHQYMRI